MRAHHHRVSIGMPVFNGEKYLESAIDSILKQSFSDFELIISDNASTDATEAICRSYEASDDRIRYERNNENLGAAPNFNRVFKLSSGEYFKWAAYDDLIAPEYLASCVEILDQKPEVITCFTQARLIDENDQYIGEQSYNPDTNVSKPQLRFQNIALNRVNTAMPVFGLLRSDVVKRTRLIGSYPSSDIVFLAELSLYGPFYEIPEKLFSWRYHPDQSTKGKYAVERDRVEWFATSAADKINLPKWQYLFGFLKAIQNAPLSSSERAHCYLQMARWIMIPSNIRAMGKDVILAEKELLLRAYLKLNGYSMIRSNGRSEGGS